MKKAKPAQRYASRAGPWHRQRIRLKLYEQDVIRRAEKAGEEYTIVKVAVLRWLWELAYGAPRVAHRERMGVSERAEQESELGKALAGAWVRIALGVPKDEALLGAYQQASRALGWKIPPDLTKEPTAKKRMQHREVTRIARQFFDLTDMDDEQREFWSEFPELTEADRERLCDNVKRTRGFRLN
jgi:hypothetical protein